MKLRNVIHPEVILNLRGEAKDREIYKVMFGGIQLREDGIALHPRIRQMLGEDETTLEHFLMCKRFVQSGGKAYYIPKDFALALSSIDKGIPIGVLPETFIGYFQLSENAIYDEDEPVEGAYVYIGKGKHIGVGRNPEDLEKTLIAISYLNKKAAKENRNFWALNRWCTELTQASIEKMFYNDLDKTRDFVGTKDRGMLEITPVDIEVAKEKRLPVFRLFVNALIYLHSFEPFTELLNPVKSKSEKEIARKKYDFENQTTLPLTILNRTYHEMRRFNVDSTFVMTHPRWQRCGPELSQVKLVWVREHERHYNKEEV